MRFRSASRPDELAQSLVRHGGQSGGRHLGCLGRAPRRHPPAGLLRIDGPQAISNPKWSFPGDPRQPTQVCYNTSLHLWRNRGSA